MKARTYRKHVEKKNLELAQAAQPPGQLAETETPLPDQAPHRATAGAIDAIDAIRLNLPQLMAVAVVDAASGRSLASHSNSAAINPDTAAAHNSEVVKQKQKAMTALALTGENIEDILVTLTNQLHLIKLNGSGNKFIYLVVNTHDTTLAAAREVLRANVARID